MRVIFFALFECTDVAVATTLGALHVLGNLHLNNYVILHKQLGKKLKLFIVAILNLSRTIFGCFCQI